ncbi:MAG: hypothetical protein H7A51_01405 [Akkermansiaceae bacterium]|nr:hypothetical protein [Akkermansiaceae bacterium]
MISRKIITSTFLLAMPLGLAAQEPETAIGAQATAGNCRCCDLGRIYAPYLKKLPAPKKRDNIGNSHLKITTGSEAAQEWFDQGLNLLHSFWEFEAYRCFLQAAKEDPDCAMAYWGICMALPGKNAESSVERQVALQKAKDLASDPTHKLSEQEILYIEMVDSLIHKGSRATIPNLRKIIQKFPDDVDAIAFLSLWLRDGYKTDSAGKGEAKPGSAEAAKLLKEALEKHPMHTGLNHYYIHVLEQGPDFEQARSAALALPQAAPGAGHLVHMPGHIYYLAGEYEKACRAYRDCDQVELAYLNAEAIPAVDNNNYLHNLHFMAYAASDQGRYQEALQAAARLAEVKVPANRDKAVGAHQIYYLSPTVTALVHMRSGNYDLAAASLMPDAVPETSAARHYILFLRSYCRLRHAFTHPGETNNEDIIQREKLGLNRHLKALKEANPGTSFESQPWALAYTACKILHSEARAWIDNSEPDQEFKKTWASIALRDYYRAGYTEPPLLITPVEESLGWLALHAGHPTQARKYFEASLLQRRQSGHAYLGIARSYRRDNNAAMACGFYEKFLNAFARADKSLPSLDEARNFLAEHADQLDKHVDQ